MGSLSETHSLDDVFARRPVGSYVLAVMRHARAANIVDVQNQLSFALNGINALLRAGLTGPEANTTATSFIQALEARRDEWQAVAGAHMAARNPNFSGRWPRQNFRSGQYGQANFRRVDEPAGRRQFFEGGPRFFSPQLQNQVRPAQRKPSEQSAIQFWRIREIRQSGKATLSGKSPNHGIQARSSQPRRPRIAERWLGPGTSECRMARGL